METFSLFLFSFSLFLSFFFLDSNWHRYANVIRKSDLRDEALVTLPFPPTLQFSISGFDRVLSDRVPGKRDGFVGANTLEIGELRGKLRKRDF